jgi:glycosyltransferase involved in cell wall biosynthesis
MRIALITDAWQPQVNGVVTTLGHVRRELEDAGDEVRVIHPHLFLTVPCPKYSDIRLAWMPRRKVAGLLDDAQPNAVHIATEGPLGLAARRHCAHRSWPFTTSYHTQFPLYLRQYAGVPERLSFAMIRWFHGAAQRTLVPTPSIKRELDARNFRNIIVWTRGVDTELFQPGNKSHLDGPRPIFLYCGRVAVEKNIEAFLNADLPGTKYVVGDGPAMSRMRLGYPAVRFVGFKFGRELARHVAAADVFVFPSRTDTFGVVMLEAMACGVPVAAFPVAGPIDVVKQAVTGYVDEDLARAAMNCLRLDPAACRDYALGFLWNRCARIFRDNLAAIGP